MVMVNLESAQAFQIVRTARLLRLHFSRFAEKAGHDLTQEQWLIMAKLTEKPDQSQVELGDSLIQDKPNITRIIAGMEKRGLVKRHPDREDKRVMKVRLTAHGRAVFEDLSGRISRERRHVFAGITDTDLARLGAMLEKVQRNLAGAI